MNEEKLKYIEYIKYIYFSQPFIPEECKLEIIKPKFDDLFFAFINGCGRKKIHIYDKESNRRFEF